MTTPASDVTFTQNATGAVANTAQIKMQDIISAQDFGAVGDGVTDDTSAIDLAIAAAVTDGNFTFLPAGLYKTSIPAASLNIALWGIGQLETFDSSNNAENQRGRFFSAIDTAPVQPSNWSEDSVDFAFNGDWSHQIFSVEHRITDETSSTHTLGAPSSGYQYTPQAYPHYTYLFNSSGYNNSPDSNDGRTAACAFRTVVAQAGQGDCVCFNAAASVLSTLPDATNFLAQPAASLFNGDIDAEATGVYLNAVELDLQDNGYDCAGIGVVMNLNRTYSGDDPGQLSAVWMGNRVQSIGAENIDVAFSAAGNMKRGLDFTAAQDESQAAGSGIMAAITLSHNQRVYFNADDEASGNTDSGWYSTNVGTDWIDYDSTLGGIRIVAGNSSIAQFKYNNVTIAGSLNIETTLNILAATTATSATSGSASALPSSPAGYLVVQADSVSYKIPIYNM